MNTQNMERLPDAELDVMRVLWHNPSPMCASQVAKSLSDKRTWKTQTAAVLLNRLCDKDMLVSERVGNTNYFKPLVSEHEYVNAESKSVVSRLCGGSIKTLVASLINSDGITENDIAELSQMLHDKEIALKKGGGLQ